jgi:iron complex transport system substrate-binding protein
MRPLLTAGVLLGVLLSAGCDVRQNATESGAAGAVTPGAPAAATAPATATSRSVVMPRDWVLEPPLLAAETELPCPRLLSAAPSVTEIAFALGLGSCLVGRTRYCTYPPAAVGVPDIGALNDVNAETLLALRPDMVLIAGQSRAIRERLARLELRFEVLPDTSLADLFAAIHTLGALTGRPQTAMALAAGVRAELDAVVAGQRSMPRRVLICTAPLADPPRQVDVAGPGSFYGDLLQLAGHTNAAAAAHQAFTPVALEYVLQVNPDVIIELVPDAAQRAGGDAEAGAAWRKVGPLAAAAAGRVHILRGPEHFVLGPRIAQTFAALCERIAADPGNGGSR